MEPNLSKCFCFSLTCQSTCSIFSKEENGQGQNLQISNICWVYMLLYKLDNVTNFIETPWGLCLTGNCMPFNSGYHVVFYLWRVTNMIWGAPSTIFFIDLRDFYCSLSSVLNILTSSIIPYALIDCCPSWIWLQIIVMLLVNFAMIWSH
jgi:hypothetical protein